MKPKNAIDKPISSKLGIKSAFRIKTINAPSNYRSMLGPIPSDVVISSKAPPPIDMIHAFSESKKDIESKLAKVRGEIRQEGMIWVSWPKKKSGIPTDITENIVREAALALDLVDVKVCSIDDKWSALKLVIPRKKRNDA